MKKIISILLFVLTGVGCEQSETSLIDTGNHTLDELLRGVDKSIINIDQAEVDTLTASAEHLLGEKRDPQSDLPEYMGRIAGFIITDDSLYVADSQQSMIWVMDESGSRKRAVGREGEGPGEFRQILKIAESSNGIYTIDRSNSRVQFYDHQLNLKDTFSQPIYGISDEQFSVSDEYLFFPSNPYTDSLLVHVRSTSPPYSIIHSFLPALIPPGYQPAAYNVYHSGSNNRGNFVATYVGTPYLFIFDSDFSLARVIVFRSSYFDELSNPELVPISSGVLMRSGESAVPGVKSFIFNLKIDEIGDVYFMIDKTLYRLSVENGDYSLDQGWVFSKGNDGQALQISNISIKNDVAALSSFADNQIYKFDLR